MPFRRAFALDGAEIPQLVGLDVEERNLGGDMQVDDRVGLEVDQGRRVQAFFLLRLAVRLELGVARPEEDEAPVVPRATCVSKAASLSACGYTPERTAFCASPPAARGAPQTVQYFVSEVHGAPHWEQFMQPPSFWAFQLFGNLMRPRGSRRIEKPQGGRTWRPPVSSHARSSRETRAHLMRCT